MAQRILMEPVQKKDADKYVILTREEYDAVLFKLKSKDEALDEAVQALEWVEEDGTKKGSTAGKISQAIHKIKRAREV